MANDSQWTFTITFKASEVAARFISAAFRRFLDTFGVKGYEFTRQCSDADPA